MILGTVAHGRTSRDTGALLSHLSKDHEQTARVVSMDNVAARSPLEAMRAMERLRDGSRAVVAMQHITISPRHPLSPEQRDEAVQRIVQALGAEDHPRVLWEHAGKARATPDGCDQHFHLVLSHVGPDLKALNMSSSYARLEAVARSLEIDWGEELTDTRRHDAVAVQARLLGRDDVAEAVIAMRPADIADLTRSGMTSEARARADRAGHNLPKDRAAVAAAWAASDTPAALRAALAEHGMTVAAGEKAGVWLVMRGDHHVGALDRLAGEKRKAVAARMATEPKEQPTHDRAPATARDGIDHPLHDEPGREGRDGGQARSGGDAGHGGRDLQPDSPERGRRGGGEPGAGSLGASAPGPEAPGHDPRPDGRQDQPDRRAAAAAVAVAQANADPRAERLAAMAREIAQEADRALAKDRAAVAARLEAIEGRALRTIDAAKRPPTPPTASVDEARDLLERARAHSDAEWRRMLDADRQVEDIERARPSGLWAAITGKTRRHALEAAQAAQERDEAHSRHDTAVTATKAARTALERAESRWSGAAKVLADQAEKDAQKARQRLEWARVARRCIADDPSLARDPAKLDLAVRERAEQEHQERQRLEAERRLQELREANERARSQPTHTPGPRMR